MDDFIQKINNSLLSCFSIKKEYDTNKNMQIWFELKDKNDIFPLCHILKDFNARCIIINLDNLTNTLLYHFDITNTLISVSIKLDNNEIDSITPLLKSANWAEKELRDVYGIKFKNHLCNKRVFFEQHLHTTNLQTYIPLSHVMLGNINKGLAL